jgi:hypothetical protein
MARRMVRLMALPLALAIVFSACGGDDDDSADPGSTTVPGAQSALDVVKRSVETTKGSGTARISHHLVSDITAFAANEYSEGTANLATGDGQWSHDMSDTPIGLVPEGTPPEEINLRVREVGDDLYVSLPPAFEAVGIDETWLRVDASPPPGTNGFTGFEGMSGRIALSSRFERPEVAFAILGTASAAREVGPATIRSKETTRYSVDVKLRTMLEEVGLMFFFGDPTEPEKLAKIDEVSAEAAHVDVFIDQIGRIRQLRVEADLTIVAPVFDPPQSPEAFRELRLAWDFYDYGIDVNVEPPTGSVLDVSEE